MIERSEEGATAGADPGYGVAPPGYRLPAGLRLGRAVLQVARLERSLAFYRDVLGFRIAAESAERVLLAPHDDDAVVVELRERPGASPVPPRGRLGLFHVAILLPERAALGSFVDHLAAVGVRAGASDHRVSEALYLQDPDGLGIEVYADRPRAAWKSRDRELVMTTEPLDLRDLHAAAGERRWSGMPAGTRIGHVHLHVGDLDGASAFYHDGLGLDRVVWGYPGALFLSAGGYHHHLGVNTWATGAPAAREEDARLVEWTVILPDRDGVEAAVRSLEAAGNQPRRVASGEVLVDDPWGTTLRLVAHAGERSDAAPAV